MSESDEPLEEADTARADDPGDDLGSAQTALEEPGRSPSQQGLHDAVKDGLFSSQGRSLRVETGKVFAGRYRIERLLGQGGMGEVFRAHDLVLDEDVALKFLPRALAARPGYYERFVKEVRLSRQVSHPSVCRVHDIGEADGQPFISMEYVDGEDLATLLRRIGRLGQEKALELSHQLCAGLAALHERGIIHRDLKPSNIMLDGEGHIRIADFGLASIAAELREHEIRDGTPAYQAPEQKEGTEATVRSDVYALGLVIKEMFVGGRSGRSNKLSSTTTSGTAIDPGIAEVIDRCLDSDPSNRPGSALEVSAALPGGDPLAAALAAGRLPSPEAVANAGITGGLSPLLAKILLGVTLVGILVAGILHPFHSLLGASTELLDPAVLEHRAVEILGDLDLEPGFLDAAWVSQDHMYLYELDRDPGEEVEQLAEFSAYRFTYRKFAGSFDRAFSRAGTVPLEQPGDVELVLDGEGQLLELHRIPAEQVGGDVARQQPPSGGEAPTAEEDTSGPDYDNLLMKAGLEPGQLERIEPSVVPPVFADELRAWSGLRGQTPVVVHAAMLGTEPVWFQVVRREPGDLSREDATVGRIGLVIVLALTGFAVLVVILRQAIATLRRREGDFRGARAVAVFIFVGKTLAWVIGALGPEFLMTPAWAIVYAGAAVMLWLAYLMLEPYARANWPRTLVSWNRLLQGRWKDPMVGRDLLIGACAGMTFAVAAAFANTRESGVAMTTLLGARHAIAMLVTEAENALRLTFAVYVALLGLHRVFRVRALALVLFIAFVPALTYATGSSTGDVALLVLGAAGSAFIMLRYGLLALVFTYTASLIAAVSPITVDVGAWYAGIGGMGALAIATMALAGERFATAPHRARPGASSAG